MRRIVNEDRTDPRLRALAVAIWRAAGVEYPKLHRERAVALARWLQDALVYVHEPIETFTRPRRMLLDERYRFGDCDEMTTAGAALFEATGHDTCLEAVGWPTAPGARPRWRHVFFRVALPPGGSGRRRRWHAVELTLPKPFGWDPTAEARARLTRAPTVR